MSRSQPGSKEASSAQEASLAASPRLQLTYSPTLGFQRSGRAEDAIEKQIQSASSIEESIILLITELHSSELSPTWAWLREFGRLFFTRVCQAGGPADLPDLAENEANAFVERAPFFNGLDQVAGDHLQHLWLGLKTCVSQQAKDEWKPWLAQEAPDWSMVGRVTFHLAENRSDTLRPFAFLATFVDGLSPTGQPKHLPLARALVNYTNQKDSAALAALLEPVKRACTESALLREWVETKRLFQPMAMTAAEAYSLLQQVPLFQRFGIITKLPDWWHQSRLSRPALTVTVDAPSSSKLHSGALLHFQIQRTLDGEKLTDEEWEKLMSTGMGLVSLRGRWVEVNSSQLQQVLHHWERVQRATCESGIGFLQGMRLLAGFPKGTLADETIPAETLTTWCDFQMGERLKTALHQWQKSSAANLPVGLRAQLRPYQVQGFQWLRGLTEMQLGACLADDMGLGKTLQVLALLQARKEAHPSPQKPTLLLVPASLIGNWTAEARKFTPELRFLVAHPSAQAPEAMQRLFSQPEEALHDSDVMLTTYTLFQRTESWQLIDWSLVILDEAQAIKNPGSGITRAVKRLPLTRRIALTGTPVENRPGDLWSLFDFLNPGLLGSASDFAEAVKRMSDGQQGFAPLRKLVQPYLLRRMKTDKSIVPDLPDKIELKTWCHLTKRQAMIYAKLVDELGKLIKDPLLEPIQRQGLILGFLLKFKQVCNHPSQWSGDATWKPQDSGKFLRLAELIPTLQERQERCLVFTQFQETCTPLASFLAQLFGREGLVLHGGTPVAQRARLVDAFQVPDGPPFMVISVKAGGTGLNLTAANHVIHFDRWWNPAVENQATDRAFRLGQKKQVLVHKMVCTGTLEQRIDQLIQDKLTLASELVEESASAESFLTQMSPEALMEWVRLDQGTINEG